MSEPLLFIRENGIARLTLNRPQAGNAIDLSLARALMEAAIECDEDDGIRCVLMTGAGRLFCAGGDVGGFAAAGDKIPLLLKELTAYLHSAISRFSRMRKPMVTAVNGPAAGAGFNMSLLGDIVLAHGVTAREAGEKGVTLEEHATHLIVHGTLHLLGLDHELGEAEAEAMEETERAALATLGISDPYAVREA